MDWLIMIFAGVMLVVVVAPVAMLLLTFFVLVPLAHLMSQPSTLARTTLTCPVSKRTVNATFVTSPTAERPTDVVQCSLFADGRVRCGKGCLLHAEVGWAPSPMLPRFALLADGTAQR
jgi:hypothetical protein